MDCIFCKIINGTIPSEKIYGDSNFTAILDINPVVKGHVLLLPNNHYENLFDMEDYIIEKTLGVAKTIGLALKKSLRADGVNIIQNNGKEAGQLIFHSHFHIIPRYPEDGINIGMTHGKYEEGELKNFGETIRKGF